MSATTARPKGAEDLMVALLLAGAGLAGVTWFGGAGYLVLSGHTVPHGRLFAGLAALAYPLHPGRAWGSTGVAPALYWAASGLVFLFRLRATTSAGEPSASSKQGCSVRLTMPPELSLPGPVEVAPERPKVGTVLAPPRARREGPSSRVRERGPVGNEVYRPPVRHSVAALGPGRLPGLP